MSRHATGTLRRVSLLNVSTALQEEDKPPPQCCLCPVTGGALKPTTEDGLWCHAACMQWIPEVRGPVFLTFPLFFTP